MWVAAVGVVAVAFGIVFAVHTAQGDPYALRSALVWLLCAASGYALGTLIVFLYRRHKSRRR